MVKAENLSFCLKSGRKILDNISFKLESSEICAVIGPNGAGKSTLMKIINGIITPSSGQVSLSGRKVSVMNRLDIARKIAYLPQTTNAVPCRVYDSVLLGRKPYISWHPKESDHKLTRKVIAELAIESMQEKCVTELSGGEFQKTLIARAMVQNADILMLDEPINHLDVKNQLEIMDTASNVTYKRKLATMIVMHDLNLALRYATKVLLMNDGKSIYCGSKEGLSEDALSEAYGIKIKIQNIDNKSVVMF
ncbi:ABC transporter related protein [Denitrovibrio acetiphilus DSM 12809]|uniref:ABC transporter related protein n=1 Tax=Denitrovibrio acetiphilus (strain DSM 12809 / NBRC 114555 / N2460) TaxID=522772 RepID=D4H6P6_DENA2|nr:ABC transporter ATP-binding protein [Denitrovibrio acetiphilus]ADD67762.1 ABC transporter related protein [Denitrovibrio acetiphilus DSM 12809]